jgi:hypothetical protein
MALALPILFGIHVRHWSPDSAHRDVKVIYIVDGEPTHQREVCNFHARTVAIGLRCISDQRPGEAAIETTETADDLRRKAARYRTIAGKVTDPRLIEALRSLATEYDALADQIERDENSGEN